MFLVFFWCGWNMNFEYTNPKMNTSNHKGCYLTCAKPEQMCRWYEWSDGTVFFSGGAFSWLKIFTLSFGSIIDWWQNCVVFGVCIAPIDLKMKNGMAITNLHTDYYLNFIFGAMKKYRFYYLLFFLFHVM